jgi:hypothetical protein
VDRIVDLPTYSCRNTMTPHRTLSSTLFLAAALLPLAPAQAATVTYSGYATADNQDTANRIMDTHQGVTNTPAGYTAAAGANGAISTSGEAHGGSVYSESSATRSFTAYGFWADGQAGAQTDIDYRPELIGPDGALVPVHVHASGYADGILGGTARAVFGVSYHSGYSDLVTLFGAAYLDAGGSGLDTFTVDETVWMSPNADIWVSLSADSSAVSTAQGPSWSQAIVDPTFTIDDPTYAALYHFEGIPGAAAAVPEPAGMAPLLLGLCALFVARRRTATPGSARA